MALHLHDEFGYDRNAALVAIHGPDPHINTKILVDGGQHVEVKIRREEESLLAYPFRTDCVESVGGKRVARRDGCRSECIVKAQAQLCSDPRVGSTFNEVSVLQTGTECTDPTNWTSCIAPIVYPEYWAAPKTSCIAGVRGATATSVDFPFASLAEGEAACTDYSLNGKNEITFRYGSTGNVESEKKAADAEMAAYCPLACDFKGYKIEHVQGSRMLVDNEYFPYTFNGWHALFPCDVIGPIPNCHSTIDQQTAGGRRLARAWAQGSQQKPKRRRRSRLFGSAHGRRQLSHQPRPDETESIRKWRTKVSELGSTLFEVRISFQDFAPSVLKARPSTSLEALVGAIGGSMGLFSGLSLLTLGEFGEFFVVCAVLGLMALYTRRRATSRARTTPADGAGLELPHSATAAEKHMNPAHV